MIKYRTDHYQEAKDYKAEALEFSNLKTQYHLNEIKGELVELPDKLDVQAQIDSSRDTALDVTLNRLLPEQFSVVDEVADVTNMADDLDFLQEAIETAEQYRERFHLDDNLTTQQIFDYVKKSASELSDRNARIIYQAQNQNLSAEKAKEIKENETTQNEPKGE